MSLKVMRATHLLKSSLRKQLGDVPVQQRVKSKVEVRHKAKEVYGGVQLPGPAASLQSRKTKPVLGLRDGQTTL